MFSFHQENRTNVLVITKEPIPISNAAYPEETLFQVHTGKARFFLSYVTQL